MPAVSKALAWNIPLPDHRLELCEHTAGPSIPASDPHGDLGPGSGRPFRGSLSRKAAWRPPRRCFWGLEDDACTLRKTKQKQNQLLGPSIPDEPPGAEHAGRAASALRVWLVPHFLARQTQQILPGQGLSDAGAGRTCWCSGTGGGTAWHLNPGCRGCPRPRRPCRLLDPRCPHCAH